MNYPAQPIPHSHRLCEISALMWLRAVTHLSPNYGAFFISSVNSRSVFPLQIETIRYKAIDAVWLFDLYQMNTTFALQIVYQL